MNEYISRLLGVVSAKEEGNKIIITGLPANDVVRDIFRLWRTNKISEHMFSFHGMSKIVMPSFFGLEFMYMLEKIKADRSGRSTLRTITAIKRELEANTWLGNINKDFPTFLDLAKLTNFKRNALPHQRAFIEHLNYTMPRYGLRGGVMAMGTGTGKTIGGLMTMETADVDHIYVISPARALQRVWKHTVMTEYKKAYVPWVSGEGMPIPIRNAPRHLIFSYEALEQALEHAKFMTGKRIGIILDESHAFNEMTAQRTQSVITLCKMLQPKMVIWSSATPIKALGSEMIPMLTTFDPLFDRFVADRFKAIFGKSTSKGIDIIEHRMGTITFKAEVVKSKPLNEDIPLIIPNPTPFLLDTIRDDMLRFLKERMNYYKVNRDKYVKYYDDGLFEFEQSKPPSHVLDDYNRLYKPYIAKISKGYDPAAMVEMAAFCNRFELEQIMPRIRNPVDRLNFKGARSVVKYVALKVRGECLGRIVGRRRTESVLALIPHAGLDIIVNNSIKKTVIFTSYVEAVHLTVQTLKAKGIESLAVYGDTNKNLNQIIAQFEKDDKIKVLVATYQSLSTAMPLLMANTMVALNAPFRDHDYQQAIGRIDRIDQDTQTEVFNLVLDTGSAANITTRTMDILRWSKEQVDAIMGTKADIIVEITGESLNLCIESFDPDSEYGLSANEPVFTASKKMFAW